MLNLEYLSQQLQPDLNMVMQNYLPIDANSHPSNKMGYYPPLQDSKNELYHQAEAPKIVLNHHIKGDQRLKSVPRKRIDSSLKTTGNGTKKPTKFADIFNKTTLYSARCPLFVVKLFFVYMNPADLSMKNYYSCEMMHKSPSQFYKYSTESQHPSNSHSDLL